MSFVDETGFDVNDPRHPRWCHPVRPEGNAPGELEKRLEDLDVEFTIHDDMLHVVVLWRHVNGDSAWGLGWVPRWPDKNGLYGGPTVSPQYCIRKDDGRCTLDQLIERIGTGSGSVVGTLKELASQRGE